jgi:DHA1 family bicyclomycin/chloramphenicol resistance-like MFS transporter
VLAIGDWRSGYALLAVIGLILVAATWLALGESRDTRDAETFSAAALLRGYAVALHHPVCLGYILVNAGAFGALFAYISGSPLLLIDALHLSRIQYSVVYAATFIGIMASVLLNARLSLRGVPPAYPLGAGIALAFGAAIAFLLAILAGIAWTPGLIAILVIGTAGFGLIAPNALHGALEPLPQHAGAVSAMATLVQILTQSAASALVVAFSKVTPGLSMAATMVVCSAAALLAYATLARSAPTTIPSHAAP